MTKIRGNSAREVVRAVTIVKVYRRPYPHHGNTSSCSRTLIVWKQSLEPLSTDLLVWKMERVKGFEPSTPTLARLCSTPELHPRLRRWHCGRRVSRCDGIMQAVHPCKQGMQGRRILRSGVAFSRPLSCRYPAKPPAPRRHPKSRNRGALGNS